MTNQEFDRLLQSIRDEEAGAEAVREAGARVRGKLRAELEASASVARLNSCADFQAMLPAYRGGVLSDARRMLVEDHLHSCVRCRRVFAGTPVVVPIRSKRPMHYGRWAMAAAALLVVGLALPAIVERVMTPSGPRGTVALVDGELYRVAGSVALEPGATIGENDEIRTGKGSRAVVRLRDGSMVEMAERSDLTLSERWRGKTVRLVRGSVMIEAAKQRSGRLEVATADCLVSVKGTIFEVSRGVKGSRVSVVEGEVKVDRDGASSLLHRGDQTATDVNMLRTPVAQDVAWSRNAAKYLELLGELSAIQKKIEAIPGPGLRYGSKLAGLAPANTMIYAAIPNVGATLGEATKIFEDRVGQSEALREWWNQQQSQRLQTAVGQVRAISDYLGDEIVLAVPRGSREFVVMAEVKKPGLREFLDEKLGAEASRVTVRDGIVVMGTAGAGGFMETPLGERVAQSYRDGVSWVFAADMEQILAHRVNDTGTRFLVIERKENRGRTETSAALSFSGERQGIASWLAAPGPMGTLDYVSPEASFAGTFVVKNPATLLGEITAMRGGNFSSEAIREVAENLGGEVTVAVDGPLLPVPSWKVAIEVNNAVKLEAAIEKALAGAGMQQSSEQIGGRTYYKLTSPKIAYEVDYTYSDGYLLAGANTGLLSGAIANRASGNTLASSSAFRAQLPQDGHVNFSALVYSNLGAQVGPVIDQLKSGGLMTPEQEKAAATIVGNREPSLIYAYGEPDRIFVASRSGFFGLGLDTLLGLNAKGAGALAQLLPPVFKLNAIRH